VNALELMFPPFVACMLLVAIHGYFGLHVIRRGVIFVDLAMAQIAALGATVGLLFHGALFTHHTEWFSAGAVAVGAAVLAATRTRQEGRVPHEAIIGIVFVVASAAALLVADRSPQGHDAVKEILVGSLLWVTWPTIAKDAVAYAIIGAFLFVLRRRFETISFTPAEAERRGWNIRWYDFLFYLAFGITVTFSVPIAGVLLVFSFLVVPAVIAVLFAERPVAMMFIAWFSGMFACTTGLVTSYAWDLPTGPVIVCSFAATLFAAWLVRRLVVSPAAALESPGPAAPAASTETASP
jgi:zinc/manganese transport system permease protein